jgi:hypothetical protein
MQPIESIETISHLSNSEHKKANQRVDMKICLLKFRITTHDPYVSVEVA